MSIKGMFARVFAGCALACATLGCSSTTTISVPVPPRVDLAAYQTIGLVTFASDKADAETQRACTQQFLRALQDAQPGTRVLELGQENDALHSVRRRTWDVPTLRAIKQTHGVDAVILGRFDLEKSRPDVELSTLLKSLSVRSDMTASLAARLLETQTGATMWSDSAHATANVAHAQVNDRGEGHFGATDAEASFSKMIGGLAYDITDDFRVHYITKRVPKDQVQTAGAAEEPSP